jgi:hypothetical protein
MAKQSLLDITQEILSDMNSDEVNSITDTTEAMQVATIIKRTFINLYHDRKWPANYQLMKIDSLSDSSRPTHMKFPEDVIEILWVKYDIRDVGEGLNYKEITYLTPEEFITLVMRRDSTKPNTETVIDIHGVPLLILNDAMPTYYTSFDDEHIVLDSYDSSVDSTIQQSKIQVYGEIEPAWIMEDEFIPDLPAKVFPYFVNEAKSTCFLKIKEVFSQKDEQNSTRQKSWLSRHKRHANNRITYPNYGRTGNK